MPAYRMLDLNPLSAQENTMYSGRGGAGNFHPLKNSAISPSSSISSTRTLSSRLGFNARQLLPGGRGGLGNFHSSSEYAIFSFDEELEQQLKREKDVAPVFHIGRGGAGNMAAAAVPDAPIMNLSKKRCGTGSVGSSSDGSSSSGKVKDWPRRNLDSWRGALKGMPS
ncbi:hypothetical protein GTR04_5431 [Trichophyton interdigitale]|uniref:Uncharacterized protein n=3 Tax=Trichophyton TaxID=5550 RepID=A0A059J451_TRIIM|nr:hypothetical protein TESG_02331 [Trichophyton tonsurans CBS 112818]EGE02034.1 hypothetical protein TEQG_01074 [Trichophyton equinum CBS 127.97]EZF28122.1 hypothetical protein H101_08196 [Trichophyton interdigitale H6]KAG5209967.1 hypothetical protein GY631_5264 [Trichophyton interdigitale]KDB22242.1 hypothetical protein H109_05836 [Trichophyton interdigitale MR816]